MRERQKPMPKIMRSERGMIAIMTTMILMIVISLIVLGFAQISRRTQRESLDRQQSTQAFYAAETGINDARQLFKTTLAAGGTIPAKSGCNDNGPAGFYASLNPVIDAPKGVRYSCLLVDPAPNVLRYSDVTTTSTIVPMITADGSNFSTIKLDWQQKATAPLTNCPATAATLPATTSWTCGYGVLRFDLVPAAGAFNADSLRNSAMTTFAVPLRTGGSASIPYAAGTTNANNRIGARCTATSCSLTITGLSQNTYFMRISSIYRDVGLQVSATRGGGSAVELSGAQAVIDATGKAQDVLRRIQVNVPLRSTSQNQLSDFAIQSYDSICKRYAVADGYFDTQAPSVVSSNRLCQP